MCECVSVILSFLYRRFSSILWFFLLFKKKKKLWRNKSFPFHFFFGILFSSNQFISIFSFFRSQKKETKICPLKFHFSQMGNLQFSPISIFGHSKLNCTRFVRKFEKPTFDYVKKKRKSIFIVLTLGKKFNWHYILHAHTKLYFF